MVVPRFTVMTTDGKRGNPLRVSVARPWLNSLLDQLGGDNPVRPKVSSEWLSMAAFTRSSASSRPESSGRPVPQGNFAKAKPTWRRFFSRLAGRLCLGKWPRSPPQRGVESFRKLLGRGGTLRGRCHDCFGFRFRAMGTRAEIVSRLLVKGQKEGPLMWIPTL